ncbi:MAG TPA: thiamine pyrophosphate-binding protein [Pseudomonadales bacterium]|jgi:acetolactate synthase-1/2/3 large subunit|nr:thiamine pyrophosphate-binding protein [Pseudomonadales bacterium]
MSNITSNTGADLAYRALRALDVEHVFGIVSVHNIPIYDAILRHGGISPIDMRHEQAAVHAADGYARSGGKLGVAITSTGPGACNAVPGLFEAGFASSPVLMLTGQIDTPYLGKGKGFLHEAERQLEMLRTVTRRAEQVRRADEIAEVLIRVAMDAQSGRPQPGAVEIPIDLQYQPIDDTAVTVPPRRASAPGAASIADAARLIGETSRRVIWAGGGVISGNAAALLQRLAEALDAPVFTSGNGRGSIPEDHALAMGPLTAQPELRETLSGAELVIAVGARFQGGATGNWSLKLPRLIHIDADASVVNRNYPADVALVGDAEAALSALLAAQNAQPGDPDFLRDAQKRRDEARAAIRVQMGPDHLRIMDAIRRGLSRQGNIVRDATVPAYIWGNRLLPVLTPRTSLSTTSAAIGPGLPLAIGAAVATGEKTVVIQGDGGFMLHIGELATAAQYQLPLIVCVFNDRGYGVLRAIQRMRFDGRTAGVDIKTPDFVQVAQGMGVHAEAVASAAEFEAAFERAVANSGPVLLDIDMNALAPMGDLFGRPRRA